MRAIREGLDRLDISTSDPGWTKAIATKLCQIGKGFGFKVGAKVEDKNRDWPERLYDVLWLDCNDIGQVVAAPLVAECEFGGINEIIYDFDKLLLARATVRLMIYDGDYEAGSKGIAKKLARRIGEFTNSHAEDTWLLAAWERCGENGWRFKYYTVGMNSLSVEVHRWR